MIGTGEACQIKISFFSVIVTFCCGNAIGCACFLGLFPRNYGSSSLALEVKMPFWSQVKDKFHQLVTRSVHDNKVLSTRDKLWWPNICPNGTSSSVATATLEEFVLLTLGPDLQSRGSSVRSIFAPPLRSFDGSLKQLSCLGPR